MSESTVTDQSHKDAADCGEIRSIMAPRAGVPVQFVTPTGDLTDQGKEHGIDFDLARSLFRDMYLARRLDTEALALQRQGQLGLWLMSLGQEAAQVGSIRALRSDDYVFPSYREHAAALARGITPADLLRQWRGVSHAGWNPHDHRFHIYSLVLGTQTLHATGYAMGVARDGTDEVVLTYFGDGASSQGDVNEALNWAATMTVPVLFFCQNNQWAISTPTMLQSGSTLHQRAAGFGLNSYLVDGNDALAVHAVTSAAAARIRAGNGPAFIEAETYRMAGHSTSDDPGKYRHEAEVDLWRSRDPLARLKVLLERADTSTAFFEQVKNDADELATETRKACLTLPDPEMSEYFDTAYAEPHRLLQRQSAEHAAYAHALTSEVSA
ncbi:thiamine pyrophosphate-dependent dehydrogenase E1 component subunit alpha [Rhodococcus opacus]|uniref:thiamine pyrophosphate-dependent dehydrogenase E1 component subunit alpha n=2 Tax=Rhodococcus opacus TaxID=37919 RepID=UPI000AD6C4DB|nr:thiamine pyrophosphate-dependent dehydrogenase E1 component subunit alpha [Rhodococcus opacus]UDH01243.1 thiamine pyrophosphate-dependent dehydrogenase E1 component subunit alpha [Rhodococcus opacus PD630]